MKASTSGNLPKANGYFVDQKKGEVNELRTLLKNITAERDPKRKRDIIKKVIAYMTLGIDVSRLFNEMVMAIETKDLVVKKMVYLYLCNYAQEHPDMALMCINTLHTDCKNEDPMVRGLALRSLCSLRLPSIVEYIAEPLRHALTDDNAYVRKTSVMGILKLYHLNPEMVKESNLIDIIYDMIEDSDGGVVANCIAVLNEVMLEEGGMAINQAIIKHLLMNINAFNEWGLSQVLDLLGRYTPSDDQEVFNIMNMLDPILRTSNSGVVLATIKVFIQLTLHMTTVHSRLYERLKAPMLTLIASGSSELVYCLLKHTELLVYRCPGIFDEDFKQFYTKFNEPLHVKYLKISLLAQLANVNNMTDILDELTVYVSDVDAELSRRSIQAIGRVGFKIPNGFEMGVVDKLNGFLDIEVPYVRAETILVLKDLLRKYPERRGGVVSVLQRCLRSVEEPEAKAAVVWMVGEYDDVLEAPYMLEEQIDAYDDESSAAVKLELLAASLKLFFRRPAEMQGILGKLLSSATNDTSSQDVHDRALFYLRLLKADLNIARDIIAGTKSSRQVSAGFTEERDTILKERLFKEFNSLSVIYWKTSKNFIQASKRPRDNTPATAQPPVTQSVPAEEPMVVANDVVGASAVAAAATNPVSFLPGAVAAAATNPVSFLPGMPAQAPPVPAPVPPVPAMDLLGFADAPAQEQQQQQPVQQLLSLSTKPSVTQDSFQNLWQTWTEQQLRECTVSSVPMAGVLDALLSKQKVFTIASGDLPDRTKLFIYAQSENGTSTFLAECNVMKPSNIASVTIKTDDTASVDAFWNILTGVFQNA
mmetsp:Transcript_47830/g.65137  ORF Transcript_47830/g.65137 Transcript_47830/m.65137 type:complete len:818 (-) Transcript_47830:405-2858(-)|eukprot:CAMPEP_0185772774 /NCGR_PEP_ID=MMETSP1174-20130828/70795_1 /TAXON_ID=35687 /ORGANISM="Dictyocha speculum, Strain CCMP1381" /LENGTH=817 /DNA_ID=CAMNT_0028459201 /DNA_START=82 /DNA_END=2535 /DNA_ORIENTATION=+